MCLLNTCISVTLQQLYSESTKNLHHKKESTTFSLILGQLCRIILWHMWVVVAQWLRCWAAVLKNIDLNPITAKLPLLCPWAKPLTACSCIGWIECRSLWCLPNAINVNEKKTILTKLQENRGHCFNSWVSYLSTKPCSQWT